MLNPLSLSNGREQFETFKNGRKTYYQYDYRHTNGELFSCVKPSLDLCRTARDNWLEQQK